jgi:2-oxoisovalerate dehydrogenase E1 component alpha subunit
LVTPKTKIVAEFSIEYLQFLDKDSQPTQPLPEFASELSFMESLYRAMVELRTFDAKAIALQRTGKMGTYPSTLGQEAITVAMGAEMEKTDVLCPYYRDYGAMFWRGVAMEDILRYWGGEERGSDFQIPRQDFPISVPIASQVLHAVGVAYAFYARNEPRVAVTSIGDGGTSKGDFYEALNFAGVKKLPTVFVVNNNRWAISVPLSQQTACQTLAQKGIAGEVEAIQVDGNDIIAMIYVLRKAMKKARSGGGPTVIEALTYRMCDHTTADDARRYRPEGELIEHKKTDPVIRLRQFLVQQQAWDEQKEKALIVSAQEKVAQAVDAYLSTPIRSAASMFDHLYETLPEALKAQRDEVAYFEGVHHG